MKKILLLTLFIIQAIVSICQPPTSRYTQVAGGYQWQRGYFNALHIPSGNSPALQTNQWTGAGGIYYDSSAHKLYIYDQGIGGFKEIGGGAVDSLKSRNDTLFYYSGGTEHFIYNLGSKVNLSDSTVIYLTPTQLASFGYITRSGISATSPITYNSSTGGIAFDSTHYHSYEYYNTKYYPYSSNPAGYLTSSSLLVPKWHYDLYDSFAAPIRSYVDGDFSMSYAEGSGSVIFSFIDTSGDGAFLSLPTLEGSYSYLTNTLTNGKFLVGNGSNVATAVTPTGDVTFNNSGVFSIGSGKVTNSMLAGSIALSKLSITGTPDGTKFLRDDGSWQTVSGGEPTITASNTVKQYWNGYKNFVNLNTDSIVEGSTNLFFTNARARSAFSAGQNINLASGVISAPNVLTPSNRDSSETDFDAQTLIERAKNGYQSGELFRVANGIHEFDLLYVNGKYEFIYDIVGALYWREASTIDSLQFVTATQIAPANYRWPGLFWDGTNWHLWCYVNSTSSTEHYISSTIGGFYALTSAHSYNDIVAANLSDPSVRQAPNGTYIMGAKSTATRRAHILTSNSLSGPWTDKGVVFSSPAWWHHVEESDPMTFYIAGRLFIMFGAFDSTTLRQKIGIAEIDTLTYRPKGHATLLVYPTQTWQTDSYGEYKVFNPVYLNAQGMKRIYYSVNGGTGDNSGWGYIDLTKGNYVGNNYDSSKGMSYVSMKYNDQTFFVPASKIPVYIDYDSLSTAYIDSVQATGYTMSPVEKWAVNNLVTRIKYRNLETKLNAVYLLSGNTANSQKWNLMNAANTDAAFRLTWNGGWTRTNNRADPDGSSGTYADTHLIPNSVQSQNSSHISIYLTENVSGSMYDMGAGPGTGGGHTWLQARNASNFVSGGINQTTSDPTATDTSSVGYYILNRDGASSMEIYKNAFRFINSTAASAGLSNNSIYLGGINHTSQFNSSRQIGFATIGSSLSAADAFYLNQIMYQYQDDLNQVDALAYGKMDTLWRDGDSLRYTIQGRAYALYSIASGSVVNAAAGTGISLVNASNEIKRLKGSSYITVTDKTDSATIDINPINFALQQDTIPLFVFSGGGNQAMDTAAFSTNTLYGSFYNSGSDTLYVTNIIAVMQGTNDTLTISVAYKDTLNALSPNYIINAGATNNNNIGTSLTSFVNQKIPPNVFVWCNTPYVQAGRKPKYLSVTMIGYKIKKQ